MTAVEVRLKPKAACEGRADTCSLAKEGRCPLFGSLMKPNRDGRRRVRGCGDPTARGAANRRAGLKAQRKARQALGVAPSSKFGDANEENWKDSYFANEVKSGSQCGPLFTWWRRVEAQVLANEADFGSQRRPVRAVAMERGNNPDGLVVIRLSTWQTHVGPALDEYYGSTA